MNTNARFTVAIHTLTLLAQSVDEPVTSETLAGSVNTNPVVIRRMLAALRAARLVTSQGGNGGGWRLTRSPEQITLCDVYRAVEDQALFSLPNRPPNPRCPVGRHIQSALTGRFEEAARAMQAQLAQTTLADVLRDVLAMASWTTDDRPPIDNILEKL